jgi:phage/plasmid-like protein (TIGR03299 family)
MPAELDGSKGRAAILSVGQTPWHREGVVLKKPPASVEDAVRLAGLDFHVSLEPLYVRSQNPQQPYEPAREYLAVRRTDIRSTLGLDKGVAHIETAGALREGRDVWVLVRFDIDDPVVQEVFTDEVIPFGLISNNHAGERRVVVQETPIRVVCSNTLGMALSGPSKKVGVRHTINVEAKIIDAAKELWGGLVERYQHIAEQYRLLKGCYLDEALFRQLVLESVSPMPTQIRDGVLPSPRAVARMEARRKRLRDLWTSGPGHLGDCSGWEAYNAVAQSIDHDTELWPTKGSRTASLFDGRLARLKQKTLDVLTTHAHDHRDEGESSR